VKGMRKVSPAVDVTSEVSGSHFRFVGEQSFRVRVLQTKYCATMKTMDCSEPWLE
jgi:hypothetical protein